MSRTKKNILTWVFLAAQLNMLFRFSYYTDYGYLIIFILAFPLYLWTRRFSGYLEESYNSKASLFIKEIAVVFIFSLLIFLSIFRRFFYYANFENVMLALSRFIFIFVFVFNFTSYLLRAELQKQSTTGRWYMIFLYSLPSLIIFTLVWLAAYPANMSPDSIYVWTAVVRNSYDALHPIFYALGMKLFTYIWESPAILIIVQILLCTFTFAYMIYRLRQCGANKYLCAIAAVVIPILPVNAIFAVTLWKDVPYTMGLILISVELVRAIKDKSYYSKISNIAFFAGTVIFTMAMRYNAPYVLLFSIAVYIVILLTQKMKKQALINIAVIAGCILVYIGASFIAKAALGEKYTDKDTSCSFYALPLQGMIALYHDSPQSITSEQMEKLEEYLYMDELADHIDRYQENDRWRNYARTLTIINTEEVDGNKKDFWGLYLEFLIKEPKIILRAYFDQTAIIWYSRDVSYISGMPWYIHYDDEYEIVVRHSKFTWLSERINAELTKSEKGLRGFFEHPASMMLLILLLGYVGIRKKGIMSAVFILPALFNSLGYMATIEGQCTRYTYINYTIAIVYFVYILIGENDAPAKSQTPLK